MPMAIHMVTILMVTTLMVMITVMTMTTRRLSPTTKYIRIIKFSASR